MIKLNGNVYLTEMEIERIVTDTSKQFRTSHRAILPQQVTYLDREFVEAIQNEVARIPLPNNLEKNGDYFGLKVQGDSMIEAGIHEGDTVIIRRTDTADNGKIVVALIDEHEAMLKRIRKKGKVVALESANRNYETKIFGPDRVKVQGVLVSLYRNF